MSPLPSHFFACAPRNWGVRNLMYLLMLCFAMQLQSGRRRAFHRFFWESSMFAITRLQQFGLFEVFDRFAASRPAAFFGAAQASTAERRAAEALALMPPHLRADAGLPSLPSQEPEHPAITRARIRGRNWE